MRSAVCNKCGELVPYKGALNRQSCQCGSTDLSAVHGIIQFADNEYKGVNYYDRKGELRMFVPQSDVPRFTNS